MPQVKAELAKYYFVDGAYQNVIVTWDWTPEAAEEAERAGVALWSFQEIMREIAATIPHKRSYVTDDTLRTINLFVRALAASEEKEEPVGVADAPNSPMALRRVERGGTVLGLSQLDPSSRTASSGGLRLLPFGAGAQGSTGNVTGEWKPFATLTEAESFLSGLGYEDAAFCGVCH